jgi:DNA-binding GntR family transcriptional regulator
MTTIPTVTDAVGFAPLAEVKGLAERLGERLAEMILTGVLKPGEHLVQTDLAERFGVSRVAVRDALHKLRQAGLAVDVPRKGTVVRSVSGKDIRDLFAIRRSVEGLATRLACERMTEEGLQGILKLIREQEELARREDMAGLIEADWRFHKAIYSLAENEPLAEIIAGLWARTRQARSLARANPEWGKGWAGRSVRRHKQIVEALKAQNAAEAERLVVEGIARAEDELVEGLTAAGWGGDEEGRA